MAVSAEASPAMSLAALTVTELAVCIIAVAVVSLLVLVWSAWGWWTAKQRRDAETAKEQELVRFVESVQKSLRYIIRNAAAKDRATQAKVDEAVARLEQTFHREMQETRDIIRDGRHGSTVNVSHTDVNGDRLNIGRVGDGHGESKADHQ